MSGQSDNPETTSGQQHETSSSKAQIEEKAGPSFLDELISFYWKAGGIFLLFLLFVIVEVLGAVLGVLSISSFFQLDQYAETILMILAISFPFGFTIAVIWMIVEAIFSTG